MFTIYKYTNIHNNKIYIGQTCQTLEQRAQFDGRNYKGCPRFYLAIQKYGWHAFVPEVLITVSSPEEANRWESYYISMYDSTNSRKGYNIALGGHEPLPFESRQKISQKAKERYKDKTQNPMYGRRHTQHARNIMSIKHSGINNPMYGSKWNSTQRKYSGVKNKKLNLSDKRREELRQHAKHIGQTTGLRKVKCIEDDKEFDSVTLAASAYHVSKSTMCGHLKGYQHTCAGKHFIYVN